MGYAFISYKREEQSKADALRNIFINNGIDCWMDVYNIPAGTIWRRKINNTIESDSCSCFVLVLTELSQSSENILDEIAAAKDANKPIIPVRFGSFKLNSDMRSYLRRLQIEDVESVDETDAGMKKVLEAVKNLAGVKENDSKDKLLMSKKALNDIVQDICKETCHAVTIIDANRIEIKEKDNCLDLNYNTDITLIDEDGSKYIGQMKNGKRNGKGIWYRPNGSKWYEGDWVDGNRHGKGTFYYDNGEIYEGNWVDDLPHGEGTYYWGNGDIYIGEWINNKRNGWGTFFYADGRTEEQYYENDELKKTK